MAPSGLPATGASGSAKDLVAIALNGLLRLSGGGRVALGLQRLLDLDQQLRLLEEVVTDDLPDRLHRQIAD